MLTGPALGSDTTPTFTWASIVGAAKYDLVVHDKTSMTYNVIRNTTLTGTSWESSVALTASHLYHAYIRAIAPSGTPGPWSGVWIFEVTGP
jgi:hypothetical protein